MPPLARSGSIPRRDGRRCRESSTKKASTAASLMECLGVLYSEWLHGQAAIATWRRRSALLRRSSRSAGSLRWLAYGSDGTRAATSGVTGRDWPDRLNRLRPGIAGWSRHFLDERTGCDRLRPAAARHSLCGPCGSYFDNASALFEDRPSRPPLHMDGWERGSAPALLHSQLPRLRRSTPRNVSYCCTDREVDLQRRGRCAEESRLTRRRPSFIHTGQCALLPTRVSPWG